MNAREFKMIVKHSTNGRIEEAISPLLLVRMEGMGIDL